MASLRVTYAAIALLTTAAAAPVSAADAERGEDLAWQHRCMTCHGETGMSSDERYPHLAGQDESYLGTRLRYFRDEVEPFNHMNGQARPLSDEDIADLAAYFSAQ